MNNERIARVLAKMEEKGLTQLIVSDPLSIRFLTGIMVNPGERLYALILKSNGEHVLLLNYLYFVSDTGFNGSATWKTRFPSSQTRSIQQRHWASTRHGRRVSSFLFRKNAQSLRQFGVLTA